MTSSVLEMLITYGLPALFCVMFIAAIGVPLPSSLILLAMGSFVAQGDIDFWNVIIVGAAGAIAGDNIGYALGRWGGRPILSLLTARFGGAAKLDQAEAFSRRWAGVGVFFSRWLVGPLGPWINVTSGMTRYYWLRFLALDMFGEVIWLLMYVNIGIVFSDQVQSIADLIESLSWVLAGLITITLLCYIISREKVAIALRHFKGVRLRKFVQKPN